MVRNEVGVLTCQVIRVKVIFDLVLWCFTVYHFRVIKKILKNYLMTIPFMNVNKQTETKGTASAFLQEIFLNKLNIPGINNLKIRSRQTPSRTFKKPTAKVKTKIQTCT